MQLEHFNVLATLDARSESYSSQLTQKDFFHRYSQLVADLSGLARSHDRFLAASPLALSFLSPFPVTESDPSSRSYGRLSNPNRVQRRNSVVLNLSTKCDTVFRIKDKEVGPLGVVMRLPLLTLFALQRYPTTYLVSREDGMVYLQHKQVCASILTLAHAVTQSPFFAVVYDAGETETGLACQPGDCIAKLVRRVTAFVPTPLFIVLTPE
jgi:hypothetical protein